MKCQNIFCVENNKNFKTGCMIKENYPELMETCGIRLIFEEKQKILYTEEELLELLKKYIKELNEVFKGQKFMLSMAPKDWLEINSKRNK